MGNMEPLQPLMTIIRTHWIGMVRHEVDSSDDESEEMLTARERERERDGGCGCGRVSL
jgi:hypothetical protein